MKTILVPLAAALALSGCATTWDLALMPRDSGKVYRGTAQDNGTGEGPITITLEDRTYTGTWVQVVPDHTRGYVAGSFGYGRRGGWGLGGTVLMDNPAGGVAKALLTAPDGTGLRCDLQNGQGFGGGLCRDDRGRDYDVQVRTGPAARK